MGIEYTEPCPLVQTFTLTYDQVDTEIVASLGLLPGGIILDIAVEKTTAFDNGAAIRLNTNGATTENVASAAEVDAGNVGMISAAAWRSALPALVRSGQQELFAYLTGGTPTAGAITVYVLYLPTDLGY